MQVERRLQTRREWGLFVIGEAHLFIPAPLIVAPLGTLWGLALATEARLL